MRMRLWWCLALVAGGAAAQECVSLGDNPTYGDLYGLIEESDDDILTLCPFAIDKPDDQECADIQGVDISRDLILVCGGEEEGECRFGCANYHFSIDPTNRFVLDGSRHPFFFNGASQSSISVSMGAEFKASFVTWQEYVAVHVSLVRAQKTSLHPPATRRDPLAVP